jgi:hypothetical protein
MGESLAFHARLYDQDPWLFQLQLRKIGLTGRD